MSAVRTRRLSDVDADLRAVCYDRDRAIIALIKAEEAETLALSALVAIDARRDMLLDERNRIGAR